ncbi:hypothetical protein [Novosphingobium sp. AP12]|uniref:hypothetical protein n=1 Tax=Novosphingobium sp. AP12 TaxID=1144305 RepID=UPI0005657C3C|nr:hypothetical protein [Novosphingobium sp. AP12]
MHIAATVRFRILLQGGDAALGRRRRARVSMISGGWKRHPVIKGIADEPHNSADYDNWRKMLKISPYGRASQLVMYF